MYFFLGSMTHAQVKHCSAVSFVSTRGGAMAHVRGLVNMLVSFDKTLIPITKSLRVDVKLSVPRLLTNKHIHVHAFLSVR